MTAYAMAFLGFMIVVLLRIIRARGRANKRLAKENRELAAALQRCERKAKESEAALKQQIKQLKQQIASRLEVPSHEPPNGSLTLTVEVLPEGTPSPVVGQRREKAARRKIEEVEQVTREAASRAIEDAHKAAALHATLESLRLRAHCESHLLDPTFQHEFAKHDPENILKTLKAEWRRAYAEFMQNGPLKRLAEEKAPELIQWLEARVQILQLAERFAITPPAEKVEVKEPTTEDARALMLSERGDRLDEQIALMELKGKKVAKVKSVADALPLEDDEKEMLKTDTIRVILETAEENERGKNGDTV